MLTILFLTIGIAVIFGLARMNKSNKLFWTLLIAMMTGYVVGTAAVHFTKKNSTEKHAGFNQGLPIQGSVFQFDKAYLAQITEETDIPAIDNAKLVGQASLINIINPVALPYNNYTLCNKRKFVNLVNPGIAMNLFDTS